MTSMSCDAADGYWVGQALNGLDYDPAALTICQSNGEYMIQLNDGTVYSTCIAYGEPATDCTNPDLVCPEHPVNPGPGKFGYGGNVRARLASALTRNDFKHPMCPTPTGLTPFRPTDTRLSQLSKQITSLFVKTAQFSTLPVRVCITRAWVGQTLHR